MRWWLRLLTTLVLAPLLWRLGTAYLASEQGSEWGDLAVQSVGVLAGVYLTFTVPALLLCGVLLTAVDWLLHRLGLDLLTVLTSPLIALGTAVGVLRLLPERYAVAAQGALALAVFYGLVWGLTVRERRDPARRRPAAPRYEVGETA